jgi:hypothetical protein
MAFDLQSVARRVLGTGPVPPPPHVLAVEGRRLSYARIVGSSQAYELRELRRVELPADVFASGLLGGPLREPALFAERVGALLGALSAPVHQASLVLPDAWLRVTFVEVGELPRAADAREEVVRWKLKRLLPFRVEDLRLAWAPAPPLPQQSEPQRLLVAYALESLLAQLEDAFAARGVWVGRITSESLALLPAVAPALDAAALGCLAVVHDAGYTLIFTRQGVPVLYRFRGFDAALGEDQRAASVARDLRLTRAFVAEQLPEAALARVLIAAPPTAVAAWQGWLAAGLGRSAEAVESLQLPLVAAERVAWNDVAPLLGAAREEVA